jgi:mannose-1-phosphate guanylyltransferase
MNVMLLAAGRGTRLHAVEPDVPKALISIGGEPLLARQLRYLETQGISRVVVNAHHLADQVVAFAGQYKGSLDLVVVVEEELLGTAGGLRNALAALDGERFIVLYGDVLTSEPLAPLVAQHEQEGVEGTLAVYESLDSEGKGTVEVDRSDHVTGFSEKSTTGHRGPSLINAGLYLIEASLARRIPAGIQSDFGYDVFPAALARGEQLAVYRLSTGVLDVGTPSTLELARRDRGREL